MGGVFMVALRALISGDTEQGGADGAPLAFGQGDGGEGLEPFVSGGHRWVASELRESYHAQRRNWSAVSASTSAVTIRSGASGCHSRKVTPATAKSLNITAR